MKFKTIKRIMIAAFAFAMMVPVQQIAAAGETSLLKIADEEAKNQISENCLVNAVAEIQKQENIEKEIVIETSEEIRFNEMLSDYVFVSVSEDYLLVMGTPDENSDWTGKIYADSIINIEERGEVWSKISSGNVTGYVKTELLMTGKAAIMKAKELLSVAYPERDVLGLSQEEVNVIFTVGETKEEEAARLAEEEAARIAAEEARKSAAEAVRRQKGIDVVSYAKRFLGNPYVYGGTSLTRGTDCSGFVKGVYSHFGVSLPRTSSGMRSVGYSVRYKDMQPGDIVCYPGHVGIYAGNGKIINAINENKGIGYLNVNYSRILTIRRIY